MQFEIGSIVDGKVTGITNYGAFVLLPDGKTGMVHISEVAPVYVKEIRDHLTENQMVKVKVLAVTPEGRINLSIKKAAPPPENPRPAPAAPAEGSRRPPMAQRPARPRPAIPRREGYKGPGFDSTVGASTAPAAELSFEDMLNRFKQSADDKQSDLNKGVRENRRAASRRTGHSR